MKDLEKAFESFSKHIEKLSEEEIEQRLSKFSSRTYSGIDLNSNSFILNKFPEFILQTQVRNMDWFNIESDYFNVISHFFKHEYCSGETIIHWDSSPPPNLRSTINQEDSNPQNCFVGFLFNLAS